MDRIFGKDEFKTQDWGPARWLKDGSGYTTLEVAERFKDSGAAKDAKTIKDIVRYAPESGQRDVLVAAESLIPPGQSKPLPIEDYAWSDDASKVLLFTNTKRVWRKKPAAITGCSTVETRELKKLGGEAAPSTLMFATFSPGRPARRLRLPEQSVRAILDNLRITQLTTDGSATIINGTSDWVYEEEFGLRNGFRWSPDGKFIAYWQFDTAGVREFKLINNTDTPLSANHLLRLPEGRAKPTPPAAWAWSRPAAGERAGSDPNADPRNHYIPRDGMGEGFPARGVPATQPAAEHQPGHPRAMPGTARRKCSSPIAMTRGWK